MTKRKLFKGKLIFAMVIIFLFILGLALWQPKPPSAPEDGFEVFHLIGSEIGEKGEIVLSKEQVNALLREYSNDGKKIGNIEMKGVQIDIKQEELILQLPITYKGLSFVLVSQGSLSFEEPNILYTPRRIAIGKFPIPKSFLLSFLEKQQSNSLIIEEGKVKVDKSLLPLSISYLAVKDQKLHITLDKEGKLQWALRFLDLEEKEKEKVEKILEDVLEDLDEIKEILIENNQKDVIDRIQRSIENMMINPDHHSQKDVEEAKKAYNTLSPQQQKEVMSAIVTEVDSQTLLILKNEFGF